MSSQHRLLQRQIRKFFGRAESLPPELLPFLEAVEQTYSQFDEDRVLLERAMRISSDELRDAIGEAQRANRVKSEFLANMSHEIRTPMNAILGLSDLLRHSPMSEEDAEHVRIIHESGESLLHLLNDVLDFSKIEAGRLELSPEAVELAPQLQSIRELFELRAARKGLNLQLEIDSTVPELVSIDPIRLRQILVNLLSNAVKFTEQGEVVLSVEAEPLEADRVRLVFAVRDTGIGIPAGQIENLFESFTQLDASTTRQYGGTGLGLAISRQLVRLMGGDLEVQSELNAGSTFSFRVEVDLAEDGPGSLEAFVKAIRASEAAAMEQLGYRCPLNILIVEDNAVNARVLLKVLERLGYSADHVTNGAEAIESIDRGRYDVVLMDVQMPVLDGIEATRLLRQRIPISSPPYLLALTAGAASDDFEQCLEAGMHAYLCKPVRSQALGLALLRAHTWLIHRLSERLDSESAQG